VLDIAEVQSLGGPPTEPWHDACEAALMPYPTHPLTATAFVAALLVLPISANAEEEPAAISMTPSAIGPASPPPPVSEAQQVAATPTMVCLPSRSAPPSRLVPDVATADEYRAIIQAVEGRAYGPNPDPEDVRRLAAMKRDYFERVHAQSTGAIVAGAVMIVIGMVATAGGAAILSSSRGSGSSFDGLYRASIALGAAGLGGGLGLTIGGAFVSAYGAKQILEPSHPRPSATLALTPSGIAGTF